MGFRANVQRAGAKTTRYSGTANVSARKVPLGSASITRAGEVVIKQGSQTTYVPPATFSGGKAAYKRYEAIRSVQGESAASQMAKEVAKGNQALRTIQPSVKGYEQSRNASVNYRLGVQARQQGIQTIQGSIGVNVASGSGGQESVQLIQPSMQAERQRSSSPIFSSKSQEVSQQPTGFSEPLSNDFLDMIGQKPIVEKRPRFRVARPEWLGGQPLAADEESARDWEGRKVMQGWDWLFNKSSRFGYTESKESSLIQAKGEAEAESITNKYQGVIESEQKKAEDVVKMAEERAKEKLIVTDRKMREQNERINKEAEEKSNAVIETYTSLKNLKTGELSKAEAEAQLNAIYKESRAATGKLILAGQENQEGIISKYEKEMQLYGEQWLPARQSRLQANYETELDEMSKKYQPYNEEVKEVNVTALGRFGEQLNVGKKQVTEEKVNPLYTEEKKIVRAAAGISKGDVFLGQYFRPAVSSLDPIAIASFTNPYTAVGYTAGRTIGTGGSEVTDMIKSFKREPLKTAAISGLSIAAYMGVGSVIAGSKGAFVKFAKAGSKVKGWGIRNFFKEVKISKGRIVERTPAAYYNLPKNYAFITGKGRVPKLAIQELPKGFRISEAGSIIKGKGRLPSSGNAIIYSQKVVQPSGSTLRSFIGWKASGKVLYAKSIGKVRPVFSDLARRIPVKVRVVEPRITSYKIIKTPSGRATIPIRTKSAFIELKYSPKEFNARTWALPEQTFWQKMGISVKKMPAKTNEFWSEGGLETVKYGKYKTPIWVEGKFVSRKIPIDVRYLFNPKYSKAMLTGKQPSFALKFIREKPVNYRVINNEFGTALYKVPSTKAFSIKIKRPSAYQDYLKTKYVVFDVSKLGRAIKYKAFQTANFVQAEGTVMKWFATQGLKNLGKKTIMKSKGLSVEAKGFARKVYAKSPVKVRVYEPDWIKGQWGKAEVVKQPFLKVIKMESDMKPSFAIKLINKGGRVKRYNLFKVNIGKKLYESAMTRKGRMFNTMYAVGKEHAGIMPKSAFKLSDWLKSQERGKILKSWARVDKKGKAKIYYQGKSYSIDELNYQLKHIRLWEKEHEMSRYAGGGVESNVNWAKVPDVLTGKIGNAVFKVPVVHPNVGSASSLGIGSASLGGLLWSQKSASGLSFKPANLSDLMIKQEQLRMSESAFDVSQMNKVEVVPIIIPKHDHLNIQKQDLGLEQLQIQELKLDFPRVPFSRGKYFKPKKWGGGFSGFEEPKKRKHYKGDSFWYFERKHNVMSGKAMMKMLFGGK